jgi:hypothetical protein
MLSIKPTTENCFHFKTADGKDDSPTTSMECNIPQPDDEDKNINEFIHLANEWVETTCGAMEVAMEQGILERGLFRYRDALLNFSYTPLQYKSAPVEVGQSKFGRGVFAKRDIKKGELLTFYPCHYYVSPPDPSKPADKACSGSFCAGHKIEYDGRYGLLHNPTGANHVGDSKEEHPLFLGHLLNDYCPFVDDFKDKKKLGETIMKYYMYGISYQNCAFKMTKHWIAIEAIKDMKKGDELLIAYSPTYWTELNPEQVMNETVKYIKKVAKTNPVKAEFLLNKFKEYMNVKDTAEKVEK